VLVFPSCLSLPLLDRGQTFDRLAFVSDDGISGKALGRDFRMTHVLGGKIDCDGCWKIDVHIF
jgi:hypothetical protein